MVAILDFKSKRAMNKRAKALYRSPAYQTSFELTGILGLELNDWNDFSYFLSTSHPNTVYQVSSQLAFPFRWRSKYIFKMAAIATALDFWSEQF